jgi:hypothetical protein
MYIFFFVFSIQKNENERNEQQLDKKTLLYVNRYNPSRISKRKHPTQDAKTTNEKDDEKEKTA